MVDNIEFLSKIVIDLIKKIYILNFDELTYNGICHHAHI